MYIIMNDGVLPTYPDHHLLEKIWWNWWRGSQDVISEDFDPQWIHQQPISAADGGFPKYPATPQSSSSYLNDGWHPEIQTIQRYIGGIPIFRAGNPAMKSPIIDHY